MPGMHSMEADWSVELGAEMPEIDAHWPGWVDLRKHPQRLGELEEASRLPALGVLLARLNLVDSRYWTAKCDFWAVEDPVDPYEMEADEDHCRAALGCYVDLLPLEAGAWTGLSGLEAARGWAEALVADLRAQQCRQSRVDVVLRRAVFSPGKADLDGNPLNFGATVYLTGCGADETQAREALGAAMEILTTLLAWQG
uniref:Uncharacterized protein n=1 Tax=mine drainage metagenome TaxID=410659 RepID=E6QM73_9ZZZZ